MDLTFPLQVLEIVWINILLSGDNAVVIALACRALPAPQRRKGILFGAGAAVLLRVVFTAGAISLLQLPWLKLVGGLLLVWISIRLVTAEHDENSVTASSSLWMAVRAIAMADVIMSLDNVVAIAAAAHGSMWLIVLGLGLSIPIIMLGAAMIGRVLHRFPIFVWLGAALLGWIAGELITSDPAMPMLPPYAAPWPVGGICGMGFVIVTAMLIRHRRAQSSPP